jgi:predicted AlkP superfamily pyrophosphatase or phosphodiesterase
MVKPFAAVVALMAAFTAASACGTRSERAISHALIVSVDGMRPDLLLRGHSPVMTSLMHRGSYTLLARTIPEVYTVPSHVSMLTGVLPARHGVTWDHHVEDSYPNVSTVFELAKAAGYRTAMAAGKTKFIVFTKPGALDWNYLANESREDDLDVARHAAGELREHRPGVTFVHFGGVDIAGHELGWGSQGQLAALEKSDQAVGLVLQALQDAGMTASTLIILTADHGGAGLLHSPEDPLSQRIPWIAAGPSVRKDFDLALVPGLAVDTMATFATVCAALGIPVPDSRDGKPVLQIFESPAVIAR